MRKEHTNIMAAVVACLCGILIYDLQPPKPYFYPLEGVWRWEKLPDLPSMGWYGRLGWALIAATMGGTLSKYVLFRTKTGGPRDMARHKIHLITGALVLALVWAMVRVVIHELHAL